MSGGYAMSSVSVTSTSKASNRTTSRTSISRDCAIYTQAFYRYTAYRPVLTMPDPMTEQLRQDMACEGLMECFHGLKQLDRECFRALVEAGEPLTVDGLAEEVDRERSTAYRSVQRLLHAGFIQKEQVNYDKGGYYHVYLPADSSKIADEMQRMLNDWYAKMGQLIREFEEKYERVDATPVEN